MLCQTLCNPMDCSPWGSSVCGIFQSRLLEWIAIPFFRGSSPLRDWNWVSHIAGGFLTIWAYYLYFFQKMESYCTDYLVTCYLKHFIINCIFYFLLSNFFTLSFYQLYFFFFFTYNVGLKCTSQWLSIFTNCTPLKVTMKWWLHFPMIYNISFLLIYFIYTSVYFLSLYPSLASPYFPIPTGTH